MSRNCFDVSSSLRERESTSTRSICLCRPCFFIQNGILVYLCAVVLYALAHILPYKVRGTMWGLFFLAQRFPAQHVTRKLETGAQWQQKRKKKKKGGRHTERRREREDRSIIHGGKKAACEEMLDFGSLPPRVQYFWALLISMSHLKVGGSKGPSSTISNATDLFSATSPGVTLHWI